MRPDERIEQLERLVHRLTAKLMNCESRLSKAEAKIDDISARSDSSDPQGGKVAPRVDPGA